MSAILSTRFVNDPNRPSNVVYPVENYTRQLQDLDNYSHLFYLRFVGRLTWHQFTEEPERVLDLGCGTGLWAIEFAKKYTVSKPCGSL